MTAKSTSERTFLGHPIGLLWLSGSEFWERFCYYGMQALLTLYLFKYLLRPEHIEEVWGFDSFRHGLDWLIVQLPGCFTKPKWPTPLTPRSSMRGSSM